MELTLVPQNLALIQQALAASPEVMLKHLAIGIDECLLLAQREIAERTPTGAHQLLRKSIISGSAVQYAKPVPGGLIGVIGTSINYAVPVELGTKPHMPPLEPLIDWVLRTGHFAIGQRSSIKTKKLMRPNKSTVAMATAVAKAIQWKIFHHGTQGAFMFRDGLKAIEPYVNTRLQRAAQEALAEIGGMA